MKKWYKTETALHLIDVDYYYGNISWLFLYFLFCRIWNNEDYLQRMQKFIGWPIGELWLTLKGFLMVSSQAWESWIKIDQRKRKIYIEIQSLWGGFHIHRTLGSWRQHLKSWRQLLECIGSKFGDSKEQKRLSRLRALKIPENSIEKVYLADQCQLQAKNSFKNSKKNQMCDAQTTARHFKQTKLKRRCFRVHKKAEDSRKIKPNRINLMMGIKFSSDD